MREEKVNSSGTVYYVRDGENVLIETDSGLVTHAHYTDFPGVWGGLASERRGATSSFYGFDQQANTRILASINGNVTDDYLYEAFGEEMAVSGSTINSLRFGGQVGYWRDEAERLYVRRRVLRVDQGRWMSRDPIGYRSADKGAYHYVGNQSIKRMDPSGLSSCMYCGPNLDKWIIKEIGTQIKWARMFHNKIKNTSDLLPLCTIGMNLLACSLDNYILNYLGWAGMNQGYKRMGNKSTYLCPKIPQYSHNCGHHTVTLCGKCLPIHQVGNIMYGLVGRALNFSFNDILAAPYCFLSAVKGKWCDAKGYAYGVGYDLYNMGATNNIQNFCFSFGILTLQTNQISKKFNPLSEALDDCVTSKKLVSYSTCLPCDEPIVLGSGFQYHNRNCECWSPLGGPDCPTKTIYYKHTFPCKLGKQCY